MDRMNVERWQLIDRLFAEALDREPDERETFLTHACAGDAELLDSVRSLLAAVDDAALAIGESAAPLADGLLGTAGDVALPAVTRGTAEPPDGVIPVDWLGPYRVIREIGRGGMGAVYLAERADGEFEKRVAIKLVKRGMDTDEILRRFQHERRILASLEHPHIARLYDGGVSGDGRPYLVMELVDGLPITEWCDARRLDIDARLTLFRTVCEAVQHAHQNLVVHRDIKPTNVFVSADGTPRLLDFGIAKLLDDDDAAPLTRTGMRLATPEYAAPEQLRGGVVTTATDVYGLGAVLYELLVGRRPVLPGIRALADDTPHADILAPSAALSITLPHATRESHVAREAGAERGGQDTSAGGDAAAVAARRRSSADRLRRRLRGDLDTIVLTALAPNPEQRYPSVTHLMDDVARHLAGLPIRARPASRWYRMRKFARRNRVPLASAALVAISIVGGAAAATVQAHRAALERDVAQNERGRAEQVTAFLVELFETADPMGLAGGGDTLRVRAVLDRGADRVRQELAGRPVIQGELLTTLGRIYTNLGAYDAAERLLEDALALPAAGMRAAAGAPEATAVRLGLLADISKERGEFSRADSLYASAIAALERHGRSADTLRARLLSERGLVLAYLGDHDAGIALSEQALATAGGEGADTGPLRARILNNLAIARYDLGEYALAESLFRQAHEAGRAHLRPNHPSLSSTLNNIASSVHYQGRFAEAESLYVEAIRAARDALGHTHASVGDYVQNLATLFDDQQRYDEAEPFYRETIDIYVAAFGRTSPRTAMALRNLGINRHAVGELAEAESLLREVEASLSQELGAEHLYAVLASASLGRVLTSSGNMDESFDRLSGGLQRLEAQLPPGHFLTESVRRDLGAWYAAAQDFEHAEPLLVTSHAALLASRGEDHVLTVEARELLRRLYLDSGRPENAAALVH